MSLLITIINTIVSVLSLIVIIYTLLRFFLSPYHPVMNALSRVIEPILKPIRKYVPLIGGLDFSPVILIIAIQILGSVLAALLRSLM
jgi:YggT family protein